MSEAKGPEAAPENQPRSRLVELANQVQLLQKERTTIERDVARSRSEYETLRNNGLVRMSVIGVKLADLAKELQNEAVRIYGTTSASPKGQAASATDVTRIPGGRRTLSMPPRKMEATFGPVVWRDPAHHGRTLRRAMAQELANYGNRTISRENFIQFLTSKGVPPASADTQAGIARTYLLSQGYTLSQGPHVGKGGIGPWLAARNRGGVPDLAVATEAEKQAILDEARTRAEAAQ